MPMGVLLLAAALITAAPEDRTPCKDRGTLIAVDTRERRLWQCEAGRAIADFEVALGTGGVDKRRQGDAKVPLGEYALGVPRASASFHTFIPLGYPTPAQRRQGYTGGDVGVHGPQRGFERLASAVNTSIDWTLGCIALGSDDEIDRIARWVRTQRVRRIVIQ